MNNQERHPPEKKDKSLDAKDKIDEPTGTKSSLPDGGLESWLQVLKAHLLITIAWGIVNSYGVFQTYYKSTLLKDSSASSISWIGTVQGFGIILISLFISPAYDRGYGRLLTIVGSVLIIFGLLMTSTANKYYQVFIYQSVCIGIGSGCVFIPALGVIAKYFDKRISLAMGIAASGAGIGGLVFPLLFQNLINRIGFAWTMRVFALISLVLILISIVIAEMYKIPHQQPPPFNFSSLGEYTFMVFNISVFFIFVGIYFPYFYIPVYGKSIGSSSFSAYFISILNSASIFGRIIPSFIADQKGPLNMLIVSSIGLVALTYLWIGIHTMVGLVIFSILYGFFAGAVMSLPTAVIAKLSSNLSYLGTQMAVSYGFSGVGFLIGTPIAGAILTHSNNVFFWAQIFSATVMLLFFQNPDSSEFAFLPSALTCWGVLTACGLAWACVYGYFGGLYLVFSLCIYCEDDQGVSKVCQKCVRSVSVNKWVSGVTWKGLDSRWIRGEEGVRGTRGIGAGYLRVSSRQSATGWCRQKTEWAIGVPETRLGARLTAELEAAHAFSGARLAVCILAFACKQGVFGAQGRREDPRLDPGQDSGRDAGRDLSLGRCRGIGVCGWSGGSGVLDCISSIAAGQPCVGTPCPGTAVFVGPQCVYWVSESAACVCCAEHLQSTCRAPVECLSAECLLAHVKRISGVCQVYIGYMSGVHAGYMCIRAYMSGDVKCVEHAVGYMLGCVEYACQVSVGRACWTRLLGVSGVLGVAWVHLLGHTLLPFAALWCPLVCDGGSAEMSGVLFRVCFLSFCAGLCKRVVPLGVSFFALLRLFLPGVSVFAAVFVSSVRAAARSGCQQLLSPVLLAFCLVCLLSLPAALPAVCRPRRVRPACSSSVLRGVVCCGLAVWVSPFYIFWRCAVSGLLPGDPRCVVCPPLFRGCPDVSQIVFLGMNLALVCFWRSLCSAPPVRFRWHLLSTAVCIRSLFLVSRNIFFFFTHLLHYHICAIMRVALLALSAQIGCALASIMYDGYKPDFDEHKAGGAAVCVLRIAARFWPGMRVLRIRCREMPRAAAAGMRVFCLTNAVDHDPYSASVRNGRQLGTGQRPDTRRLYRRSDKDFAGLDLGEDLDFGMRLEKELEKSFMYSAVPTEKESAQNLARGAARAVKRRAQVAQNVYEDEEILLALILKKENNLEEAQCKQELKEYCKNLRGIDGNFDVNPKLKDTCTSDTTAEGKCTGLKNKVKEKCTEFEAELKTAAEKQIL
ncbi:hypothetical protein PMAC_001885, partial [Pneumocystis sp. 'macacae']